MSDLELIQRRIAGIMPSGLRGSVVRTTGTLAAVASLPAPIGAVVEIERQAGLPLLGEVVALQDHLTMVAPFGPISGIRHGNRVRMRQTSGSIPVGPELLGRVINARGRPVDGLPAPVIRERVPLDQAAPAAVERPRICQQITTGVRAIDTLLSCGRGQRMGIFSAAGVGKSVTLGMMARYSSADVNVIALIGERGREVNEFIERDLGRRGLAKSVVVTATGDEPALFRVQAALAATSVAEYFRQQGRDVLLIMDSLTRFAIAQRELGLSAGEPPTTRGYPPSVFAMLPRLVERAGLTSQGSITGFYSVLVEGDDTDEPISDAVRGLLDGHTILSRKLAARNHYPAIDILSSISRLMPEVAAGPHQQAAAVVREVLAAYQENEDLIAIGAYRPGSDPKVDAAIALQEPIQQFLRQSMQDEASLKDSLRLLIQLATQLATRQQTVLPNPQTATPPPNGRLEA